MFCRNCGTQNADGAPTCTACGAELSNPYQAAAAGGQPQVPMAGAGKPENYLVYAILVTLCCCLPCGIVGIVYAAQVDSKWNSGDQFGAISAAKNAKTWTLVGFGVGLLLNIVVGVIQVVAIVGAANAGPGGGGF